MISKKCHFCDEVFPADISICPKDGSLLSTMLAQSIIGMTLRNRYELQKELGRGGMGIVYLALDKNLERQVAVKMLMSDIGGNEVSMKRFTSEAKLASSLDHRNIIRIYDFDISEDGLPYMVMDYVRGIRLSDVLQAEDCLTMSRAMRLFTQLGSALAHAHRNNILHRDLKPDNIMLISDEEDEERPVLLDFGIAKLFAQPGKNSLRLTKEGEVFGTPLYLSPEQCTGRPADIRSDIYAFGCVMYEALTGVPPFKGENYLETIYMHVHDTPKPMPVANENLALPMGLQDMIMTCLEKDPDRRPQSALEIKREFERFQTYIYAQSEVAPTSTETQEETSSYIEELIESAHNGDTKAQYNLAWNYHDGDDVPQNYLEAFHWFNEAAKAGHAPAWVMLGHMYYFGDGVEENPAASFRCYMEAAVLGDASGEYNVGLSYQSGRGVDEDPKAAFDWFLKAANQNHEDAQDSLASCYEYGKGVEANADLAFYWYTQSATQGSRFGQFNLARCYRHGIGIRVDPEQAVYWLTSAAMTGYVAAQLELGLLYHNGDSVPPKRPQAIKWLGKAADGDNDEAQKLLAEIYREDRSQAKFIMNVIWGRYKSEFSLWSDGCAIHEVCSSETVSMVAQSICQEIHKYDFDFTMPAEEVRKITKAIQMNNPDIADWDYLRVRTKIRIPGYIVDKIVAPNVS